MSKDRNIETHVLLLNKNGKSKKETKRIRGLNGNAVFL